MAGIESDNDCTVIESIATTLPPFTVSQADASDFMLRTEGLSPSLRKRIPQIYMRSGIEYRHTVLQDYTRVHTEFDFYPQCPTMKPAPTTAARNDLYKRESIPLAIRAADACLSSSRFGTKDITHIIVVSCTGFFAPGLDIHLVKHLGLSPNTQRTVIGFMGCFAAFNAMRLGDSICRSAPNARVLIVCIELCTLHFQIEDELESVVVNALFSDGAAAVIMARMDRAVAGGSLAYRTSLSLLDSDSMDAMSWGIGDTGYLMGLSPKVPDIIGSRLPEYAEQLMSRGGIARTDVQFWAVHPGGRQILDRTTQVMELTQSEMSPSYTVLRDHGNMSSPTVLYILERILAERRRKDESHGFGVALAFGPGLTIEGCVLEYLPVPRVDLTSAVPTAGNA